MQKIASLLELSCGSRLLWTSPRHAPAATVWIRTEMVGEVSSFASLVSFNPAFLLLVKQQPALAHLGVSLLKCRVSGLGFRVKGFGFRA